MHIPATLRFYQNIGGIEKELASVQQQLTMLSIFAVNKQQALMTLLRLQRLGVKEDEIYGLSKILDLSNLGKEREWTNNSSGNGNDNGTRRYPTTCLKAKVFCFSAK